MRAEERKAAAEAIVGYEFMDPRLVVAAFTHPSAAEGRPVNASYERLEFLGDAVLGAIVAREVYERFPEMDEGRLTELKIALVEGKMLSSVAEELGIAPLIRFGESELGTHTRGMKSALEDVYEALVGALYLDGGYDAAQSFVVRTLGPYMVPEQIERSANPKTRLQDLLQTGYLRVTPTYALESETGPAHARTFTSVAYAGKLVVGRGSGSTKKESERVAAADAIKRIEAAGGKVVDIDEAAQEGADQEASEAPCI